jgi:two-component system sensor histidine kinase YesM
MISNKLFTQWWKPKNYRLRTKLIISYILVTLLPMTILLNFSYQQYIKLVEDQVGENIPKILDQANSNLDKQMSELESLPDLLYSSDQVLSVLRKDTFTNQSDQQIDNYLVNSYLSSTYLNDMNPILGVFVWSKNRTFLSTKVPYSLNKPLNLQEDKSIVLQDEANLRFKGNPSFFLLTRKIQDFENQRNLGTIAIAINLSFIEDVLMKIKNQSKADIWVMNDKGKIIYGTNPERIGTVENMKDYPTLNGSFRFYKNNLEQLISVSESEETGWIMVYKIPAKYITAKAEMIKSIIIAFFVIMALAAFVISILLAWGVSRPLYNLSKMMKSIEKGNLDVDLNVDSKDEIGVLAHSFNSMVSQIKDLIKRNVEIELHQQQAKLYALQSQINPHFMYNTLETISMAVEENENDIVVEMVSMLGTMLRFSLSNKNHIVPFSKEIEHAENYLTIQKYRFEERLTFHIHSEINKNQLYSPKFILQPIIENCIKHGLEERIEPLTISIQIRTVPGINPGSKDVLIRVADDGGGINEETLYKIKQLLNTDPIMGRDSGFGLINVHARIALLFGAEYGLTVESGETVGTVIVIRIPVIEGDENVTGYERNEVYIHEYN